ncbi:MAG: hypothetical protein H8D26_02385 [Methanomicrobia archaeon]|nr:hypothetical protein [Methanomicrobia archaeon]
MIVEALPTLSKIVSHDKDRTIIDIIASTGGTTISSLLPGIIQNSHANSIEISLLLIDSKSPFKDWFPNHWLGEVEMVIERIKNEFKNDKIRIDIYTYDNLPILHGIMVNKKHLIFGFFGWRHFSGKIQLSGAERPHRYYNRKEPGSEYFFDLFEDWFEHCPRELIYSFPERISLEEGNSA